MKKLFYLLIFSLSCLSAWSQDSIIRRLSPDDVMNIVKRYHPVAVQAGIGVQKAAANVTIARGNFDPTVGIATGNKTFGGIEYYQYVNTELVVPTWYGIEVHTGTETLSGSRLNPEETRGETNFFGASIPLAKDLIIDKRRAFLKQAKVFSQMALTEQRSIVNNVMMDAMEAYWNWVRAHQVYVVVANTVDVYEKRLDFIRRSFVNGERAAIDTVEAVAQLQSFQLMQNDSWVAFQNAGLQLSAYLWTQGSRPYTLPETVTPVTNWEIVPTPDKFNLSLPDLLSDAEQYHPDLLQYNFKLESLAIDKKLKFQELLPKLDFNYNILGKGLNPVKSTSQAALFNNNYLYGFKFELPLRLSKGRGEYKMAGLKIKETTLAQAQKQLDIRVKIRSYYNEMLNLQKQVALQASNYDNYQRLVRAEEIRLINGESTLFLINSRESKALEARQKLIELKTKYYKTLYALQWSAGFPKMR